MNKERIYNLLFSSVYPLYIQKVEKKGRTKEELDEVIFLADRLQCQNPAKAN